MVGDEGMLAVSTPGVPWLSGAWATALADAFSLRMGSSSMAFLRAARRGPAAVKGRGPRLSAARIAFTEARSPSYRRWRR
jgi:hypothetical protein